MLYLVFYLIESGCALLLASTVRYIAGLAAAILTFVAVLAYALWLVRTPGTLLLCSATLPILVQLLPKHCLLLLQLLPIATLALLWAAGRSTIPAGVLFLASGIALLALAYRARVQKRLLD